MDVQPCHAACAARTACAAASSMLSLAVRPASARMRCPSSALVPERRTTIGTGTVDSLQRFGDALRHDVAAGDAAEDIDEDRAHVRVGGDEAERLGHLIGAGAAADVEEVGRLAAVELHRVHRGHRQPGAIDDAADVAVELDERDAGLARVELGRVFRVEIAQRLERGMTEQGVVVDGHLGVERQPVALRGQDEGVDLGERRVFFQIGVVELPARSSRTRRPGRRRVRAQSRSAAPARRAARETGRPGRGRSVLAARARPLRYRRRPRRWP